MTEPLSCESCDSIFQLEYEEEEVEDSPGYCPFCGAKIFIEDKDIVYEDEFERTVMEDDVDI